MKALIDGTLIGTQNDSRMSAHDADYHALSEHLQRRGLDIDEITKKAMQFAVAIPSWGVGTGGTRFARFSGIGEPRHVFDK